jgi:hypothetical protein
MLAFIKKKIYYSYIGDMEITKVKKCKNIWLNTIDCTVANGETDDIRRVFKFQKLPLIQIRNKSYLKVNSITLSGAGHQNATGHNWTVKLHDVKYSQDSYYNSDNIGVPTIAMFNFDTKYTIQNGLYSLELEEQDIVNLRIEVYNEAGAGLVKSLAPIELNINLIIEEYEDY